MVAQYFQGILYLIVLVLLVWHFNGFSFFLGGCFLLDFFLTFVWKFCIAIKTITFVWNFSAFFAHLFLFVLYFYLLFTSALVFVCHFFSFDQNRNFLRVNCGLIMKW